MKNPFLDHLLAHVPRSEWPWAGGFKTVEFDPPIGEPARMLNEHLDFVDRHGQVVMPAITLHRDVCIDRWAWAIPSPDAIAAIGAFAQGAVVEMGAGRGYWAWLLEQAGVEVHAYDHDVPRATYTAVRAGAPSVLADYDAAWTLFLCWPPYEDPMALDALKAFRGDRLVYIGEGAGGCTGDDAFHRRLAKRWREVAVHDLPQWEAIHDRLRTYTRKR